MSTSQPTSLAGQASLVPEQLPLLTVSERPAQFRLDRRTRELGLANIAAIRRQMAARRGDATSDAPATAAPMPARAPAPMTSPRRRAA